MINAISTALSGLTASLRKLDTAANNIANVSTSGALTPENGPEPYSAQLTTQQTVSSGGVKTNIINKDPGFITAYAPNSPFANTDGEIGIPNVDLAEEAVNLKLAEYAYKANLKVIETTSELTDELLEGFNEKA